MNKTAVILIGHGSRVPAAKQVLPDLANMLARASGIAIDYAFMQFAEPTIVETVERLARKDVKKMIFLPVFLASGQHVLSDLPALLKPLGRRFTHISFLMGEPFGSDHRLVEILNERLASLLNSGRTGEDIAATSFRLIEGSADLPAEPRSREVAKRVVHATGDPRLGRALVFSPKAIDSGIDALRARTPIVTDVMMVKAGISVSLLPGENDVISALTFAGDSVSEPGPTRAARGMLGALKEYPKAILAIGNAPTALNEVCRLIDEGAIEPPLVVGTPVGFVGAVEAKAALAGKSIEFITLPGTRGGSPIAAAIVNALAILAGGP